MGVNCSNGNILQLSSTEFQFIEYNKIFDKCQGHFKIIVDLESNTYTVRQIGTFRGLTSMNPGNEIIFLTESDKQELGRIIGKKLQGAYYRDTTQVNNKGEFLIPGDKDYWSKKYLITMG